MPLHAYGPGSPKGLIDGPEIGRICARAMGLNLDKLNKRLFVHVKKAFSDGRVLLDKTDKKNPVVKIEFKGKCFELPVNKNVIRMGNKFENLEGIVVYAPNTNKAYIPMQAINIIKGVTATLPSVLE